MSDWGHSFVVTPRLWLVSVGLIMPTDLVALSAQKRKAQAETQVGVTMVSILVIIWLFMLLLALTDQSFAEAVALMGLF